jgi:hypothetical protein
MPFPCRGRCVGVLIVGCLASITTISPHSNRVNFDIHCEAAMVQVWSFTSRLSASEFGDVLQYHDRANLEYVSMEDYMYTWRVWLSKCGDASGGYDRVSLKIQLEAVIDGVWRRTWTLSVSECRSTWRQWSSEIVEGGQSDGTRSGWRCDRSWTQFIGFLVTVRM